MFIRIKKIKNQKYAYLVENKWLKTKKSTRQKTKKYLGRVITPEPVNDASLVDYYNLNERSDLIKNKTLTETTLSLIKLELHRHGFQEQNNTWILNDLSVDFNTLEVLRSGKPACIELNQGFLTQHTLEEANNFKPPEATKKEIAKSLATSFVSCGLEVEPNFFIQIFQQYYSHLD